MRGEVLRQRVPMSRAHTCRPWATRRSSASVSAAPSVPSLCSLWNSRSAAKSGHLTHCQSHWSASGAVAVSALFSPSLAINKAR